MTGSPSPTRATSFQIWASPNPPGTVTEIGDDDLERAFELLLLPAVRLVRLCLPHLEASPAGRVICITSTVAREPVPQLALSNALRKDVEEPLVERSLEEIGSGTIQVGGEVARVQSGLLRTYALAIAFAVVVLVIVFVAVR